MSQRIIKFFYDIHVSMGILNFYIWFWKCVLVFFFTSSYSSCSCVSYFFWFEIKVSFFYSSGSLWKCVVILSPVYMTNRNFETRKKGILPTLMIQWFGRSQYKYFYIIEREICVLCAKAFYFLANSYSFFSFIFHESQHKMYSFLVHYLLFSFLSAFKKKNINR